MKLFCLLKLLLVAIIILAAASCKKNSLSGRWKVVSITFRKQMEWQKGDYTINLNDVERIKDSLYKDAVGQPNEDSEIIRMDKEEVARELDSTFNRFQQTSLILKSDSSFTMISNGLIVADVPPDLYFGDTLSGTWSSNNDSLLTLNIGEVGRQPSLVYKIARVDEEHLILKYFMPFWNTEMFEIRFARN